MVDDDSVFYSGQMLVPGTERGNMEEKHVWEEPGCVWGSSGVGGTEEGAPGAVGGGVDVAERDGPGSASKRLRTGHETVGV